MLTGTVKFFSGLKSYGFLISDSDAKEFFTHKDDIAGGGRLNKGDKVSFELGKDRKGRVKAVDVRRIPADAETVSEADAEASPEELEEKIPQAFAQDVSAGEPEE